MKRYRFSMQVASTYNFRILYLLEHKKEIFKLKVNKLERINVTVFSFFGQSFISSLYGWSRLIFIEFQSSVWMNTKFEENETQILNP